MTRSIGHYCCAGAEMQRMVSISLKFTLWHALCLSNGQRNNQRPLLGREQRNRNPIRHNIEGVAL
jgi:hypothetical protein